MSVAFWIILWKTVFFIGVGLFAVLAVAVTIGGFFDIRRLFRSLHERHADYRKQKANDS